MNQTQSNENQDFNIAKTNSLNKHIAKIFTIMCGGLLLSTISGYLILNTNMKYYVFANSGISIGLGIAQLACVFALGFFMHKLKTSTLYIIFGLYSILTGVTFAALGLVYASSDITLAFGITTIYFASLCAIGYTTKINLSKLGPFLSVSLLLLIIFNVVGLFINLEQFQLIACSIGLIIFTLFTAYDMQKAKELYNSAIGNEDVLKRYAIFSALQLYLDFINLFIYILQLLASRD